MGDIRMVLRTTRPVYPTRRKINGIDLHSRIRNRCWNVVEITTTLPRKRVAVPEKITHRRNARSACANTKRVTISFRYRANTSFTKNALRLGPITTHVVHSATPIWKGMFRNNNPVETKRYNKLNKYKNIIRNCLYELNKNKQKQKR